jgi:hypothetical protein
MEQEHEENGGRRARTTGRWKNVPEEISRRCDRETWEGGSNTLGGEFFGADKQSAKAESTIFSTSLRAPRNTSLII